MLFDTNIWLALTFSAHPHHSLVKKFFARCAVGNLAYFCRVTQQSFLRLATTPIILQTYGAEGLSNKDATILLGKLHQLPRVGFLSEPPKLQPLWLKLAAVPSASPKLWMDAYLAAFAIRHRIEIVTLDGDFRSFNKDGLKVKLLAV